MFGAFELVSEPLDTMLETPEDHPGTNKGLRKPVMCACVRVDFLGGARIVVFGAQLVSFSHERDVRHGRGRVVGVGGRGQEVGG